MFTPVESTRGAELMSHQRRHLIGRRSFVGIAISLLLAIALQSTVAASTDSSTSDIAMESNADTSTNLEPTAEAPRLGGEETVGADDAPLETEVTPVPVTNAEPWQVMESEESPTNNSD